MPRLTVSLAQMPIAFGDVKRNYSVMEKMVKDSAARNSKLIVLPELWSTGYDLENAKNYADEMNKGMFAQISKLATQYKIAIAGSLLEKRGLEVANSMPLFAPNGRMMGIYRKIHLFQLMEEDKWLQPGSSSLTIDLPWGATGMAICYDLRFPELFRRYAVEDQVTMVILSAEWPLVRIEHWRTLLMARAIENQCYIVATNTAGEVGDTVFGGHSMVVDPWGKIIVEAGEEPQLLTVDIELDRVKEAREKIPVFDDRRDELY